MSAFGGCSGGPFKIRIPRVPSTVQDCLASYKEWIATHPGKAGDVEGIVKLLAYVIPGRIHGNSAVIPELLYGTANLISFWHDTILISELEKFRPVPQNEDDEDNLRIPPPPPPPRGCNGVGRSHNDECRNGRVKNIRRLQVSLTVLEYFEVFLEVAAKRIGGEAAKWGVIVCVQTVKAVLRGILVFYYKVGILRSPPIASMDRTKFRPGSVENETTFVLKSSGRVIRTLHTAPPLHQRDWTVPAPELDISKERSLPVNALLGELLHVTRPLCHLATRGVFGGSSWVPWLTSLTMDVTSLYLHSNYTLHPIEAKELSRRQMALLIYLVRSPFYDRATKRRILGLLEGVGGRVPVIGNLFLLLAKAIPEWQTTYSYVWS